MKNITWTIFCVNTPVSVWYRFPSIFPLFDFSIILAPPSWLIMMTNLPRWFCVCSFTFYMYLIFSLYTYDHGTNPRGVFHYEIMIHPRIGYYTINFLNFIVFQRFNIMKHTFYIEIDIHMLQVWLHLAAATKMNMNSRGIITAFQKPNMFLVKKFDDRVYSPNPGQCHTIFICCLLQYNFVGLDIVCWPRGRNLFVWAWI